MVGRQSSCGTTGWSSTVIKVRYGKVMEGEVTGSRKLADQGARDAVTVHEVKTMQDRSGCRVIDRGVGGRSSRKHDNGTAMSLSTDLIPSGIWSGLGKGLH